MLEVRGLSVSYGQHRALEDVSLRVAPGEIVVILGANGAGKSTLLRAVGGLCEGRTSGAIEMNGVPILGLPPHRIVEAGIALVPERRGIFADLTVQENLLLGAYCERARAGQEANLDRLLTLFPKLADRRRQVVRTMSGGEQQMVAIARAMMSAPAILMLDEPSLGLSPLLCRELFRTLAEIRQAYLGILLVEQNAKQSLAIADRGYLLENARILGEDSAARLADDPEVQKAYLGVAGDAAPQVVHAPCGPAPAEDSPRPAAGAAFPMREVGRHAGAPDARADDLIGESVEALARRAAARQAARSEHQQIVVPTPPEPTGPAVSPGPAAAEGDRLRAVLAEIEQAASAARQSRTAPAAKPAAKPAPAARPEHDAAGAGGAKGNGHDGPAAATPAAGPPPEIEVWKRAPRIEVYRRAPGSGGKGRMIRVEEGDDG